MKPEVYGCLSLIRRHEQAMLWVCPVGRGCTARRLTTKHLAKIQKLRRRAERLSRA